MYVRLGIIAQIIEIQLSMTPKVRPLVGWPVCYDFLKVQEVTLWCSNRSSCSSIDYSLCLTHHLKSQPKSHALRGRILHQDQLSSSSKIKVSISRSKTAVTLTTAASAVAVTSAVGVTLAAAAISTLEAMGVVISTTADSTTTTTTTKTTTKAESATIPT